MDGTEILSALKVVTSIPRLKGYPTNILILTDGEIFTSDEVLRHVHENSDKMRFCSDIAVLVLDMELQNIL